MLAQLIDPVLDFLVYHLLTRLTVGRDLYTGVKFCRGTLMGDRRRPLLLLCHAENLHGPERDRPLQKLLDLAVAHGVPVVYSLRRHAMGDACGLPHGISAVAVMGVPDGDARELLAMVMRRGAEACRGFVEACAAAAGRGQQPVADVVHISDPQAVLAGLRLAAAGSVPGESSTDALAAALRAVAL